MEDRAFLDPSVTATVFNHLKKGKRTFEETGKEQFTQRELEVLRGIAAGLTDHKIAESLYISTHTVRSHIKSLFRKLNVSSKSQAAVKAISNKIIVGNK